jgi:hypothetical protein
MKTVKITANPKTGEVFTPNEDLGKDGKIYGNYRVESKELDQSGPLTVVKTRSAFRSISQEQFEKGKELLTAGTAIEGKIVRKVTLTPQYEGHKPQQVPVRDAKGNVIEGEFRPVTVGGKPTYLKDEFTTDQNAKDELLSVAYDKVDSKIAAAANTKLG